MLEQPRERNILPRPTRNGLRITRQLNGVALGAFRRVIRDQIAHQERCAAIHQPTQHKRRFGHVKLRASRARQRRPHLQDGHRRSGERRAISAGAIARAALQLELDPSESATRRSRSHRTRVARRREH